MATEADILALEDRRWAAQIGEDLGALGELLADEMRYTHSNGVVDTKTSYIKAIETKVFDYRSSDRTNTEVQLFGGAALVTGQADINVVTARGDMNLKARYTVVWAELNGAWQLITWQSTPLPA